MTVIINGSTGIDTVQDGIVTDSKLNLTANSQEIKDAINATGSAPIYAARAWVNFNGTGTPAIRASGNVSSITDAGVGNYTVNLTNAMPDTNSSVCCGGCFDAGGAFPNQSAAVLTAPGANGSSFSISSFNSNNSNKHDATFIYASIFR
jgi:hypothetical protein